MPDYSPIADVLAAAERPHNPLIFDYVPNPAEGKVFCRTLSEITLRDLFAACALASSRAIDRPVTFMEEGPETAAAYAKAAYALADAMLERRAKP